MASTKSYIMFLNVHENMKTHNIYNNILVLIFQIVYEKINFGPKIRVPPQAKSEILGISPKPTSPQAFQNVSSPPGRTFDKI
jgi:hypothetical protein